jgi:hypothetical protein
MGAVNTGNGRKKRQNKPDPSEGLHQTFPFTLRASPPSKARRTLAFGAVL